MRHEGRGVIRVDDQTDHGGKVIAASSSTIVMGRAAALEGDMTTCPRCKGQFAIKTDRAGAKHDGKHYAYHGDMTECGARLISSLDAFAGGAAQAATDTATPQMVKMSLAPKAARASYITPEQAKEYLSVLRAYSNQGNREGYWNYLAFLGVEYAQLALGVVRNDSMNGYIANGFAQWRASEMRAIFDERRWNDLGVHLMQEDYQYRKRHADRDVVLDAVLELPVKDIAQYHADTFVAFGLDKNAWTAYVPLAPYLERGDDAGAEAVWKNMMNPNFFIQVSSTVSSNLGTMSWSRSDGHLVWLGKVSILTASYTSDPMQSFSNPDKIGIWYYEGGKWYRINSDNAMPGRAPEIEYAPPRLEGMLNNDRNFRRQQLKPMPKHSLDRSTKIRSR
jgi:uncharacterized Zn-binding protein involved in type VI secretion